MKDELGGKVITDFAALRPKRYIYLIDNNNKNKKAKGIKKCYKHCLQGTQFENKINHAQKKT